MQAVLYEFIGTAMLMVFGSGVVANVLLNKSKGYNGGWIVITFGWAIGVFTAVFITAAKSGAHLNPAITLALTFLGRFSWSMVPAYLAAQTAGAFAGSVVVWIAYRPHFNATEDAASKLAIFCTAPAIRSMGNNFLTELIGTFVLVFGVLYIAAPKSSLGALDALPVALLVFGIGLSLGGPTGYAINPARDLGPRIAHFLLPIKGKGSSDWSYAWVPILGPVAGSALAAMAYHFLHLP
jgi:glycerol uptake facilitator protein